jgi:uncharacterized protein
MLDGRVIEVRAFKWPRRLTAVARARLLGEDEFGRWLGVARGDPWWGADGTYGGEFEASLVKVVPGDTFWTACFNPLEPLVDVDIVLPVRWTGDTLEEIDLELDILRYADGSVRVRDREEFERMRVEWAMPNDVVERAEETCARVREMVEQGAEPFGEVGRAWLARLLAEVGAPGS